MVIGIINSIILIDILTKLKALSINVIECPTVKAVINIITCFQFLN